MGTLRRAIPRPTNAGPGRHDTVPLRVRSRTDEMERAMASWAARGIHTASCKQVVWEIMASRKLKGEDLLAAGFPLGATVSETVAQPNESVTARTLAVDGRVHARVYKWTGLVNNIVETFILTLILANVLAVVYDAIAVPRAENAKDTPLQESFEALEMSSTVVFSVE